MAGRPKPTNLKLIEGNPGKRPLPEGEPKPRPKCPDCPSDINHSAKATWRKLAPILERLGLLTEADGETFAALCQIRARLAFIHKQLQKKENNALLEIRKSVEVTEDGRVEVTNLELRTHPYVVMEKQYYALLRSYASDFGLSPRGRAGLTIAKVDKDDGEDLLS